MVYKPEGWEPWARWSNSTLGVPDNLCAKVRQVRLAEALMLLDSGMPMELSALHRSHQST